MATTFTYVSLQNLQQYDSLIKPYIDGKVTTGIANSLKTVSLDGNTLKFYTVAEPISATAPAFTIELPQQDLANFLTKFEAATAGDVVIVGDDGKVIKDSGIKLTDLATLANVDEKIAAAKKLIDADIKKNTDAIAKLNGDETTDGSIAKAVKTAQDTLQGKIDVNKKEVDGKIGTLTDLTTDDKTSLVKAINENKAAIDAAKAADKVTLDTTTTTDGMLKSYTVKQGTKTIGVIDIPKDMVVKSGVVEENPVGQKEGTYIVLTLANATEDKIYINVASLVDIYTAEKNAVQVQLTINPTTREISAVIVAGSIGTVELADGAITTVKIADGVVTKAKLATEVQASLDKADSALQEADIADLKKDVAANKASLAEGGATDTAIKAAKQAADDAKAAADEAKAGVSGLNTRVKALEDVKYVAATETEIKALFPTAQ
jgi:hypothetical protein